MDTNMLPMKWLGRSLRLAWMALALSCCAHAAVDLINGNYLHTHQDIELPGSLGWMEVSRTYSSLSRHTGLFGAGWCSTLETRLEHTATGVALVWCGAGRRIEFPTPVGGIARERGGLARLSRIGASQIVTLADGSRYHFSSEGRFERWADQNGNGHMLAHDGDGRIASLRSNTGETLEFKYNPAGLISMVSGGGRWVRYRWDEESRRLAGIETSGGSVMNYDYDARGRLAKQAGAIGEEIEYEAAGRVSLVRKSNGCVESYHYPLRAGQPSTAVTRVSSHCSGQKEPVVKEVATEYATDGSIARIAEEDGTWRRNIAFLPDMRLLPAQINWQRSEGTPGGERNFTHDAFGRLVQIEENWGGRHSRTRLAYAGNSNRLAAVTTREWPDADAPSQVTVTRRSYRYDGRGNLASCAENGKIRVRATYDRFGRVSAVARAGGPRIRIRYAGFSNRIAGYAGSNGASVSVRYGPDGEIASLKGAKPATSLRMAQELGKAADQMLDSVNVLRTRFKSPGEETSGGGAQDAALGIDGFAPCNFCVAWEPFPAQVPLPAD